MIEQVFTWTCDAPGCENQQSAKVWSLGADRPIGLTPLEGWTVVEKCDGLRTYCRECSNKSKGEQQDG